MAEFWQKEDSEIMYPQDSDTLALYEYIQGNKSSVRLPEVNLLIAILEEALNCLQRYFFASDKNGAKLFRDAKNWVFDENAEDIFSFNGICGTLNLDPGYLRTGIDSWLIKLAETGKPKVSKRKFRKRAA